MHGQGPGFALDAAWPMEALICGSFLLDPGGGFVRSDTPSILAIPLYDRSYDCSLLRPLTRSRPTSPPRSKSGYRHGDPEELANAVIFPPVTRDPI